MDGFPPDDARTERLPVATLLLNFRALLIDRTGRGGAALRRRLTVARDRAARRRAALAAALVQHRHGTWLLLFALVYSLLWLVAGSAGLSNGVGRALAVGLVTALAVDRLFPLKPRARR